MSEHRTSKYARSSSWAAIRETCSYERDQLQSIHMGAISICTVRNAVMWETKQLQNGDNRKRQLSESVCGGWLRMKHSCVVFTPLRFVSVLHAVCVCCCCCCSVSFVVCYGFVQLSLVAFPLSATTQHTVCICVCVGVNATTDKNKAVWNLRCRFLCFVCSSLCVAAEFLLKSHLSITSSDWSIQAWDLTIQ